ncbi:glycosyltransferase family 4 protein [bacterium]|nr:glycosyltransferase family 4 protein [bacterium]
MSEGQVHAPAAAQPLRVVVISLSRHRRGGVATVLNTLAEAGFFSNGVCYHSSCGDGVKLAKLLSALRQWLSFSWRIGRSRPDLVHIHFSSDMSFWRKVPYMLLLHQRRIPLLLHVHPSHFWDYVHNRRGWVKRFIVALLRRSDGIIFANRAMIDRFRPLLPEQRLYYVHNPIDTRLFPFSRNGRKEQALFLGAILKGKGVYDIVRAAPLVLAQRPHCRFVFCGDHEIDKLRQTVQEHGLQDHFEIHSWVDYAAKKRLLAESALLLLPSYSEGFPMVVLEAMASGLPVITTQVGGMADALKDGAEVLFIEPANPALLAEKTIHLLEHVDLQQRLAERALAYVQRHSVERVKQRITAIYQEIAAGAAAGSRRSGKSV